jgi:hypothetical protein
METPQEIVIEKQDKLLPIFFAHGLNNNKESLNKSIDIIKKYCPDAQIYTSDIGCRGYVSEVAQAKEFANFANSTPAFKDGFTVIGYSNGGILTRLAIQLGILEYPVESYIAIVSPENGTNDFPGTWDETTDENIAKITTIKPISIIENNIHKLLDPLNNYSLSPALAQLWNNPKTQKCNPDGYLVSSNSFIKKLNNEEYHPNFDAYKHNISTLAICHCIAAKKDTIVTPYQSAVFGYYHTDGKTIVPLEERSTYENLGLRDLGKKYSSAVVDETHGNAHQNQEVIEKEVIPYLAKESDRDISSGNSSLYEKAETPLWQHLICCK